MSRNRTHRYVLGAAVVTLLAGVLSATAVGPASANHGMLDLQASPELGSAGVGGSANIAVDLSGNAAGPQPIAIDAEIMGGPADSDGDTPQSPDTGCAIEVGSSACTFQITGLGTAAGTSLVRVWIDHAGTDADFNEGRLASNSPDANPQPGFPGTPTPAADCRVPEDYAATDPGQANSCGADITPALMSSTRAVPGSQDEQDNTDVVQVTFTAGLALLDCDASNGTPTDSENTVVSANNTATFRCKATDVNGGIKTGIRVDGENAASTDDGSLNQSGANDPDIADSPADYDSAASTAHRGCVTGEDGSCIVHVPAVDGDTGSAIVCIWTDNNGASNDTTFDPGGAVVGNGGDCDLELVNDAESDDLTDSVSVQWAPPAATTLDLEPETASSALGTDHTVTARVLDQSGLQFAGATTVGFEFLSGSAVDTDGSTPTSADGACTTQGSGDNPGTCAIRYRSTTVGTDTICGWFGTPRPSATCNGETQAGDATDRRVDVVTKTWTAAGPGPGPGQTTNQGYTLVAADGGIFNFGTSQFHGSTGSMTLNQPVIGMAHTPGGGGYWLVAKDGGVFTFGDAEFFGSTGSTRLNAPVLGMESTPSGKGYFLFAADGGIFTFGDAAFKGSTGDMKLNAPMIGMAETNTGQGYWLVAQDGGIFTFGDAPFHGSTGSMRLNEPVFDMAAATGDGGYWLVARDGGIFTFGPTADFYGSAVGSVSGSAIGIAETPAAKGYWIADSRGAVFNFGDAQALGDRSSATNNAPIVGLAGVYPR